MTLSDLLARFPDVVEERDGYVVPCPAHADSHNSLRLTVSDRGKVLLRCRAGCETDRVLGALDLSLRDLATMTAGDVTIDPATSTDTPAGAADVARLAADLDRWHAALFAGGVGSDSQAALEYATARFGVDALTADHIGLGYAADLGGGPRLVVPFRDGDGIPRGYQARALAKDAAVRWLGPKSPEGASWAKVGLLSGSSDWDEVVVTEGPGDGLTACATGYDAVLIRGAGLAGNPAVVEAVAALVGDRTAVVAGDNDNAGRAFSATLAHALTERGTKAKVVTPPNEGDDLTDWRARNPARFATDFVRAVVEAKVETSTTAALRGRDLKAYPLTDLGNARYVRDFVKAQGSGVRFSPEVGFYLLSAGVWRPDKLDTTRAYVQEAADKVAEIARDLMREAEAGTAAEKAAKAWNAWAKHSQSSRGIDAALRELQALRDVAADVATFDARPDLLACRNGVVNLRTGALLPHDPELLLTRRVDLDYRPEATCPRWEQFLEEVFPAYPDLPAFTRRLVGYGITGSTAEQCFAVLWGTGANGKSVFTDTLTEVFRELTVTTPFSTFEERSSGGIPNDLAALKGARLVMAAEGEQGRPMAEAVLKRVTGRDLIAARFMRKEFFEFRPTFLLLLATNFKPNFKGQDEGLWRRVKLIPWERYFAPAERDHRLSDNLLGEAEGIFAWAVRGAVEWFRSGLGDPPVVTDATKEYRETSDALAGFCPGVFVIDHGATQRVTGKVLFDAYLDWTDEENLPAKERWKRKTFFAALEERGATKKKTNKGVAFEGIRRARATDFAEPEEGGAEVDLDDPRAVDEPPADSPTTEEESQHPTSGPSLDDVF